MTSIPSLRKYALRIAWSLLRAHCGIWVQCFTQESVDLMGRIIYGPHVGVGDIAGVGPGAPGLVERTIVCFPHSQLFVIYLKCAISPCQCHDTFVVYCFVVEA